MDEVLKVLSLFETKYYDFTVKHFHEKLHGHGVNRSYTWTKRVLQEAGVVKKAPPSRCASSEACPSSHAGNDATPGRFRCMGGLMVNCGI